MTSIKFPDFKMIEFPGVNAVAICDCKAMTFRVGLEVDVSNNHIRCLECVSCGHKLGVPFFHDGGK